MKRTIETFFTFLSTFLTLSFSPTDNINTSFWSFKRNVDIVEPLGTETQLFITINDKEIISRMYNPYEVNVGDELTFQVDPSKVHFFDKETEKAII